MLWCKNCSGKLYEEEIYWEDRKKFVQIGCHLCAKKLYIPWLQWVDFIERFENATLGKWPGKDQGGKVLPTA